MSIERITKTFVKDKCKTNMHTMHRITAIEYAYIYVLGYCADYHFINICNIKANVSF